MMYYLPIRYFKTWDSKKEFILYRRVSPSGYEYSVLLYENKDTVPINWQPYTKDIHTIVDAIVKIDSSIINNLPLIESTDLRKKRDILCSTILLRNGRKIKRYLPKNTTIRFVKKLKMKQDYTYISTGNHVLKVNYDDIIAILLE